MVKAQKYLLNYLIKIKNIERLKIKAMIEINVLIVDDHPIFRSGLKTILESAKNILVIGEADDGKSALEFIKNRKPEIIILDVDMPGMNGIEVAKIINASFKDIKIILLTMYKEEDLFNEALDIGIMAYILKENAISEVINAIHSVNKNEYYISPAISTYLVNRTSNIAKLKNDKPGIETLTDKEKEILNLIALGKTSKDIAEELYISYKTVENHRSNICNKLQFKGTNALLKFAISNRFNF